MADPKIIMITLLSPTKTQSSVISTEDFIKTKPIEIEKAAFLIALLTELHVNELATLMKISEKLADHTKKLITRWQGDEKKCSTRAIDLFQGDAFQKLNASSLSKEDIAFSQDHLIILSALYGYLSPLDFISPYRLDMKDALKIPGFGSLYHYWKEEITQGLNNLLLKQKNNFILNLASSEFFKVIDLKKLNGHVIYVDFRVKKDNAYKTIGVYAKRGRGLLARYILQNKIDYPEEIIKFNQEGFCFSDKLSTPDHYVFFC